MKGSGKFLGIGRVAASTTNSLRRCAALCVLAADVAILLPHAVRTAECARLGRSAERGIRRDAWCLVSVRSRRLALNRLGMSNAPAGLYLCRRRDTTAGC